MENELTQLFFLRNKKTGRFLIVEPETDTESDWGYDGYNEKMVDYVTKHLSLRDSEWQTSQVIFCTLDPGVIEDLLKEGKCSSPKIQIDFGWNSTKFEISDLEVVSRNATTLAS